MSEGLNDLKKNINDGFFEINFLKDGVYLTVHPPFGKGKMVESREVIERLNRKKINGFKKDFVELIVVNATKIPVKIADKQEELKINAVATVMISPDKMKAFLTINSPEGGRMISMNEMIGLLNNNGVICGTNRTTLETLAKYPIYNEMICIAESTPPVNGANGSVDFHFEIDRQYKPTILGDGSIDFRDMNLIESAKKGQVLATLVLPFPGIPGKTVLGTNIPALSGKPAVMPKGKNVEISADGQFLIASIDGQIGYIDGRVNIFSTYEVKEDVDNSTGNISFVGNVSIRGNVLSGFMVEAGGNVEVWGVVEGAVIKAGGDIILRTGMQGIGKGILVSKGDIIAKYIEHSNISAENNIKAEAIMHSNVKCGNKLELSGKKGLLIGGTCKVGKEIVAKVIGSYMATVTDIEVGMDPALREKYKALKDEIILMESDLRKAEQAIFIFRKLEATSTLSPEKQAIMTKSLRTKLYYTSRINECREEMLQIETKLQQEAYGKVRATDYIYPGTKVAIGSSTIYIRENLQYCTLYRDGADVRVGPIDK